MNSALQSRIANGTNYLADIDFEAIPQLTVSDADSMIVFLSPEGVFFINQTDDLWYRGIVPGNVFHFPNGQRVVYVPDEAASPMGCVQRFQYCNSNKKCGSLASEIDSLTSAMPLFHEDSSDFWSVDESSDTPEAISSRFDMFQVTKLAATTLYSLLNSLGPSSLISSQHLNQGMMGPLPNNQWQLDVTHWFSMRMASIQAAFVNTARGPTDEAVRPYITTTDDKYQRTMCNNQASNCYVIESIFF